MVPAPDGGMGVGVGLSGLNAEAEDAPLLASRRLALMRLGLAAAAVYVAPTVLHLDRSANARVRPTPCHGRGGRRCRDDDDDDHDDDHDDDD